MLSEGISPIVYHFTSHVNALNILNSGNFNLTASFKGDVEEKFAKKLYFLSTTRSKQGSYHYGLKNGVMFIIDGEKVNQRYKGSAINYWGTTGMSGDEMEDRIHHHKPTLPIKDTLKAIEIIVDLSDTNDPQTEVIARITYLIYRFCKKKKIECIVYQDKNHFKTSNRKYRLSHSEILKMKDGEIPDNRYARKRDAIEATNPNNYDLYNFLEIYYRDYENLSSEAKKLHDRINNYSDTYRTIHADISNSTTTHSPFKRRLVTAIGNVMRREGVSKFRELYRIVEDKVKKEHSERAKKEKLSRFQSRFESNKEKHLHIQAVMEKGIDFNRSLFHDDDYTAMMQISQIVETLSKLDMLSDNSKSRWMDEFGLTEIAFEFLFKFDIN